MKLIKFQPSEFVDQITADGQELTKLPYPFIVLPNGEVAYQDFWQGEPKRVVGFQRDLALHQVDLWWEDVLKDPQRAVGMYMVSVNGAGGMGVHTNAISSVEEIEA